MIFFRIRRRVDWLLEGNVSEKSAVSIFRAKGGNSKAAKPKESHHNCHRIENLISYMNITSGILPMV
jgi:hypothetical protein